MKVLSLFDGMACGMIAMQLVGMDIESYDAYEIDQYAIKTAKHNFPMIKEHGDVFEADFTQYQGVDFLIGGSPCTYWSIAQTKNRETVASGMGWELFSQYVRALHEAKPKYFIYENNKSMSKDIRASIDKAFGFEAVLINSALVSAQNRQRLYWVGRRNEDGTYSKVNVEQPEDRGILLKDVLDNAVAWREKAYTIDANYYKATDGTDPFGGHQSNNRMMAAEPLVTTKNGKSFAITANYVRIQDYPNDYAAHTIEKSVKPLVAEPVCLRYERTEEAKRCRKAYESHEVHHGYNELNELHPRPDGKTNTLTTVLKDNQIMEPVSYCTDKNMEHLMRDFGSKGKIVDEESKTPTLMAAAGMGGGNHIYYADSIAEPIKELSEKEMDYMVRDHQDRRCNFCNKPAEDDKSKCVTANTHKGVPYNVCAVPINDILQVGAMPMPNGELSTSAGFRIYSTEAKGRYLCANGGGSGAKTGLYAIPYEIEFDEDGKPTKAIGKDGKEITIYEIKDGKITIKGKRYPIKLRDGYYIIRKLTVSECKRLQTVPEWYEFPVSNSQAYKMLGNGWTCEVIAHILKYLKEA